MKTIFFTMQALILSIFIIPKKSQRKIFDFTDIKLDLTEDDIHNIHQELKQME